MITLFRFRLLTWRWLYGVLAVSLFAFGAVDTGVFTALATVVFGVALVWAARKAIQPFRFALTPLAAAPAIIALSGLAQTAMASSPLHYETAAETTKWLTYTVFFLLAANTLEDRTLRRRAPRALAWIGFALAVVAILQKVVAPDMAFGFRPAPGAALMGPLADRDHFAVVMELLLPCALLAFIQERRLRPLYAVHAGIMIAAVLVSGSRIAYLLTAGEVAVFLGYQLFVSVQSLRKGRATGLTSLLGLSALGFLLFTGVAVERISLRLQGHPPQELAAEAEVRRTAWELFKSKPAAGYGLGSFVHVYNRNAAEEDRYIWLHAHSDPLEIAMSVGVAGFAAQLLILVFAPLAARGERAWLAGVLPLAAAWLHSWRHFPFQTPGVALTALILMALIPRSGTPFRRKQAG